MSSSARNCRRPADTGPPRRCGVGQVTDGPASVTTSSRRPCGPCRRNLAGHTGEPATTSSGAPASAPAFSTARPTASPGTGAPKPRPPRPKLGAYSTGRGDRRFPGEVPLFRIVHAIQLEPLVHELVHRRAHRARRLQPLLRVGGLARPGPAPPAETPSERSHPFDWHDLPEDARTAIQNATGTILSTDPDPAGATSEFVATLHPNDTGPVFGKGIRDRHPGRVDAPDRARATAALSTGIGPRLLW